MIQKRTLSHLARSLVACGLLGCSDGSSADSSETHFLACAETGDCASLGAEFVCVDGYCHEDVPDDGDGGDGETCAHGSASTCSGADTCATLEADYGTTCGGELSLFLSDGCLRQSCLSKNECATGERCGFLASVTQPSCSYESGGGCVCTSQAIDMAGSYCFPDGVPLPGRDWESFTFQQGAGPCPPESTCRWVWTVTPDGTVVTDDEGVPGTATLSAADLAAVDELLRSDAFLKFMVQGDSCPPPPTDVSMLLTVDAGGPSLLEQDVTGCVYSSSEDAVKSLWEIVQPY